VTKASDKPLVWLHTEIKTPPFSQDARIEAGVLLRRLQRGEVLTLPQSRAMSSIGSRCHELSIMDRNDAWRIIFRIDSDAIVIVEVFSKKSQKTPATVIERCRDRLRRYDELAGQR
jgi:phage-related protein